MPEIARIRKEFFDASTPGNRPSLIIGPGGQDGACWAILNRPIPTSSHLFLCVTEHRMSHQVTNVYGSLNWIIADPTPQGEYVNGLVQLGWRFPQEEVPPEQWLGSEAMGTVTLHFYKVA